MRGLVQDAGAAFGDDATQIAAGVAWGMAAAAIWSGWWVMTRAGVTTGLAAPELAALRFGVAGVALFPVFWRDRQRIRETSPLLLLVMAAGAGAPYALVAGAGLRYASAGNGGALTLGLLPPFTALMSCLILKERIDPVRAVAIGRPRPRARERPRQSRGGGTSMKRM